MARVQYTSAAEWHWPRKESTWHKLRKGDITATSAAALFGVSPYQTPYELFHILAGNVQVEIGESERMLWGKRLQNAIAQGICEDNGWQIVDGHEFLYARSKPVPGFGASPDYVIEDTARPEIGLGLLEIKNVDSFIARQDWADDEAPVHIEFQLQHQLGVTGLSWGAVGGLVGGNSTRVVRRDADPDVIAEIKRRVTEMHDRVKRNDPPPADYLADFQTIRTLYRNAEVGKSFDLDNPGEEPELDPDKLRALIVQKHEAGVAEKLAKEDHDRAKAELLEFIGETETVFGSDWKVSATTTHKEAKTIEYPATSFRNLRVTKKKPKKEGK